MANKIPTKASSLEMKLVFTTTKLLSYLIFTASIPISIYLKSKDVFLESVLIAAALQGVKSAGESLIARQQVKAAAIHNTTVEES